MCQANAIGNLSGLPALVVVSCFMFTACDDPLHPTADSIRDQRWVG